MSNFSSPEWDKKFRSILADIEQNKCVVLIGPELVNIGNRTLREVLRRQLQQSNPTDIVHYYDRDDFFLFTDKIAKEDVRREIVLFYEKHHTATDVDESIFLDIARLKTHLVLSINPDRFLSNTAFKHGIKHRFAYFQHGGEAVQEVETPSIDMPLYYNIFGSLEKDESLVLEYDDLFKLLTALLGTPGLPPNLALSLQQAKHFLFVGFDFEKWYSQLLLRLLSGEKAIRKFAIDHSKKNESTTIFLVKQFGIEFIDDEKLFWAELIRRAEAAGSVRQTSQLHRSEAIQAVRFLASGQLLEALNFLHQHESFREPSTRLLARYHDLREREVRNYADPYEVATELNRIVDATLETLTAQPA